MTLTVLLAIAAFGEPIVEYERVVDDRIDDRVAVVVPHVANRIWSSTAFRTSVGRTVGSDRRGATLLDTTLVIAVEGVAIALSFPRAVATDAPTAGDWSGNIGLSMSYVSLSTETYRLAVRGGVRAPTAGRDGAYGVALGSDLPRLAPRTTTLGAAALFDAKVWRGVVGAAAGADALHYGDPGAPNPTNVGLWLDGYAGAPFAIDRIGDWRVLVSPMVEVRGRSTITWRGAATEVLAGAGVSIGAFEKDFAPDDETRVHALAALGWYSPVLEVGPGAVDATGRLLLTLEFGFGFDDAVYRPVRDDRTFGRTP